MTVGRNQPRSQRRWLPDPSEYDEKKKERKWDWRISGRRQVDDNPEVDDNDDNFAPNDPFFTEGQGQQARRTQGNFNQQVMEWANSFKDVPYGWGGQTYGGRQSAGADDFTCTAWVNNFWHRVDKVVKVTTSRSRNGYGIDCSGFVEEVAYLAGLNVFTGDGFGTSGLISVGDAKTLTAWGYVRAGDFIVRADNDIAHVVYARGNAVIVNNQLLEVPTIEADPTIIDSQRGRVRERTRDNGFIGQFTRRRWKRTQ